MNKVIAQNIQQHKSKQTNRQTKPQKQTTKQNKHFGIYLYYVFYLSFIYLSIYY